jgi:DNA-directed RNA polymerase I subunit RPA1
LAGTGAANVTLGIPRLREIIMTASGKIKTPVMDLPFHEPSQDNAMLLSSRLNRLALAQFCSDVHIQSYLKLGTSMVKKQYRVRVAFHPMSALNVAVINGLKYTDFVKCVDTELLPKLNGLINRQLVDKKSKADGMGDGVVVTGRKKKESAEHDEDGGEDGEEEGQSAPKKKKKERYLEPLPGSEEAAKRAKGNYDQPDDEDEEAMREVERQEALLAGDDSDDDSNSRSKKAKADKDAAEGEEQEGSGGVTSKGISVEERRAGILAKCSYIASVVYLEGQAGVEVLVEVPHGGKRLLMGALVEQAARDSVLRATKGIQGTSITEKKMRDGKTKEWITQTDGVNLGSVYEHQDLIDVNRINLNDIAATLKVYGVEAARANIVNQIQEVFAVYGIQVNRRHLTLLADYMTFAGGYKPLNRLGMSSSNSPFQKISFETSVNFLLDACLHSDSDRMTSPSAQIVLGAPPKCGTGHFELLQPVRY